MGIISGVSPKHVFLVINAMSFVREFWWGSYGLGAISPRKSPNIGDFTTWADLIV